ncbi:MAG: DUF4136 domain-containing protein [Cyclobacteriaceae bacterium]|nr:DUF4136 domain-containing protein [Cyclobacteriaceae bacterium]
MKAFTTIIIVAATVLLNGCMTFTNMKVKYDKEIEFNKYKTYAWLPDADRVGNNDFDNDFIRQRIRNYIGHCLSERQYVADTLQPDLLVRTRWMAEARELTMPGLTDRPSYYNSIYYADPFTIRISPRGKIDYTNRYPITNTKKQAYYHSGVEVLFIDAKTKEVIWNGFTSDDIYDPRVVYKELHPSVHKMMKQFPD